MSKKAKKSKDSLNSLQYAKVVDLISEGEIAGLKNGLQSIYLNDTQLQNPDGSLNFKDVAVYTRNGTQAQDYIPMSAEVEDERPVGVKVEYGTPIVRTITDPNANAVRITITIPQLQKFQSDGDIKGYRTRVQVAIQYGGGGYTVVIDDTITGRTADPYQRDYLINFTAAPPIDIKVIRPEPDSDSQKRIDAFSWSSYTEIIYAKLRYPNSALVGLRVDAQQFSGVPSRSYLIRGIKVQIPSNASVDQATGRLIYSGIWNGSFGAAQWCSDPAWILWDLLTSKRYGLGDHIQAAQLDKWSFYAASQYASELVPDGFGGQEPRFSCNVNIQTAEDAYKLINDMCSVFRAMPYWSTGSLTVTQDRPADSAYLFTPANVGEEGFSYQGGTLKGRPTVAVVSYLDLDQRNTAYEVVEDQAAIAKWGVITTQVSAFACTSRGQASRIGEWVLYSEQYETEVVNFTASIDAGVVVRPGQIIEISDPVRSEQRRGGRIVSATTTQITIDDATDLPSSGGTLSVILPDGTVQTRGVISIAGNTPEPALDPFYENIGLLLHMDGTNNSTVFTDSGPLGLTVAAVGDAKISTAQSKFGGESALFDGTGDYLTISSNVAVNLAGEEFTVEAWVYPTSVPGSGGAPRYILRKIGAGVTTSNYFKGYAMTLEWSGALSAPVFSFQFGDGTNTVSATGTTQALVNQWYHVAATFDGSTLRIFVNGALQGSVGSSLAIVDNGGELSIGRDPNTTARNWIGYIDELRITRGVPRYTNSFTAPTEAFPDDTFSPVTAPAGTPVITLSSPLTAIPNENSVWVYQTSDIQTSTWRVLSVTEQEDAKYAVAALAYNSSKYNYIERGARLEQRDITNLNVIPDPPSNLKVTEALYESNGRALFKLMLDWRSVLGVDEYQVRYREQEGNWVTASIERLDYEILDAVQTVYEIEVYSVNPAFRLSPEPAKLTYAATGKSASPENVANVSLIPIDTASAIISWDRATELDVILGGKVLIRHSVLTTGAIWDESQEIVPAAAGSQTQKQVPLLEGTYLLKFEDDGGRRSASATIAVVDLPTPQPRLLVKTYAEDLEDPVFNGNATDMVYLTSIAELEGASGLVLATGIEVDSLATDGNWDGLPSIDSAGGVKSQGEYEFGSTYSFPGVFDCNMRRRLVTQPYLPNDFWDDHFELIDTWDLVDRTSGDRVNALTYVRTTLDDPSATPVWGEWREFSNAIVRGRGFQFKTIATSADPIENILIKELGTVMELQQRIEQSGALSSGTTTYQIVFESPFFQAPNVGITAYNMATGDYFLISNVTRTGFQVVFKEASGGIVSRNFTYTAVGYGREV